MSKTFLKILAEEMPIWPRSAVLIWQQMDGVVFYEDAKGHAWELGLYSTADGGFGESVTRSQWEAERARIALSDHMDKALDAGLTASGNRFLKGSGNSAKELAAIACGKLSKEDQELWDKVAISAIDSILQKEYAKGVEYKLIASECFEFADMFMAERAKRMK